MAIANDVYLAHLQNFAQEDPKDKSQKFLFQFNELGNQLHRQFDIVADRLRLPLEQLLMTYPSLGNLMDAIQQEDMGDKNREFRCVKRGVAYVISVEDSKRATDF